MKTGTTLSLFAIGLLAASQAQAARAHKTADGVFGGKPLAPIAISWEIGNAPAVGQVVEIALDITPAMDLRGAVLTLGADDPLALIEPAAEVSLGDLEAGQSTAIAVSVLPLIDQTHHLDVIVRGEIGGQPQVRSIAIAIRLPGGELRKTEEAAPAQRSVAEAVQSMPAVETVY